MTPDPVADVRDGRGIEEKASSKEYISPDILSGWDGEPVGWFTIGHVNKRRFKGACIRLFKSGVMDEVPDYSESEFWKAKVRHEWFFEKVGTNGVWDFEWFPVAPRTPGATEVTTLDLSRSVDDRKGE